MGAGMAEFVSKDLGQGTVTLEEYDLYCHYVAGLVGEGLSRMFAESGLEDAQVGFGWVWMWVGWLCASVF